VYHRKWNAREHPRARPSTGRAGPTYPLARCRQVATHHSRAWSNESEVGSVHCWTYLRGLCHPFERQASRHLILFLRYTNFHLRFLLLRTWNTMCLIPAGALLSTVATKTYVGGDPNARSWDSLIRTFTPYALYGRCRAVRRNLNKLFGDRCKRSTGAPSIRSVAGHAVIAGRIAQSILLPQPPRTVYCRDNANEGA
jgi:hypothetical protein